MFDPKNIEKELINIAKTAGEAIMNIYKKDFEVIEKNDGSPLTLADQKAHDIIEKSLTMLTPDIPILSEESQKHVHEKRKDWQTFWLVDPLDGTKEFVKKNGEFTVNIALIHQGTPIFGVVYAPALMTLWLGGTTIAPYKIVNEQKTLLTPNPHTDTVRIVASRSHSDSMITDFIESIENNTGLKSELVSMGSSIKMCLIAEGSADIYPRLKPTSEWDTAAAHAIVIAAGGDIVDLEKRRLSYNKDDILNPYFICYCASAPAWDASSI